MKRLRKFLREWRCMLFGHVYSWRYLKVHSPGAYDEETWIEMNCECCGKVKQISPRKVYE